MLLVYNQASKIFTEEYYRLRGARLDEGEYMPVIYILHNKLLNKEDFFSLPKFNKTKRLLKLGTWKIIQKSSAQPDHIKIIRPGQVIESTTEFFFRDRQYPILSIDGFKRKKRANFTSSDYEFKNGEKYSYSEFHARITRICEMKNQKELENWE